MNGLTRISARSGLESIRAYQPPRVPASVDVRLDANEGPAMSAPELEQLLATIGPESLRRYPDARPLEAQIAGELGIDPARVIVTAGGDEAIDRTCRAYLEPGRNIIFPSPSFEMIRHYAILAGGAVTEIPWLTPEYPTDSVLHEITQTTSLIAVVSPNNPTGGVASAADLHRLALAAPHALLLVDGAYAEFAREDPTFAALALPNALVVRTFSKAWGLAGIRVGYAAGPATVIDRLRAVGGPFPTSSLSLALAGLRLRTGREAMLAGVERVLHERGVLTSFITSRGHGGKATPFPSQGNFVLARFKNAVRIHSGLLTRGISVRAFATPPLSDCLRITCPAHEPTFTRLIAALSELLQPGAEP